VAGAHRHRVADIEPAQGGDGPEPRVHAHHDLAAGAGSADPGDELVEEPPCAPGGVGARAQAGVEHLTGVGPAGQDGVVAEHLGVAERRSLLVVALDLTDGRVHVDHQPGRARAGAERPRPAQHLTHHRLELADMSEGERPQECAERRGRHHPVGHHPLGATRAQHVGVVDVGGARHHGVDQGEHLAPRAGAARPSEEPDHGVDHSLQIQAQGERGHQDQPGVGHEGPLVEGHLDAVDSARYSLHWKCLPGWG
jgi:hypothetical protein